MTAVFLLIILTGVNAFFTASEMAFITINDNKIRFLADEGDLKAKKVLLVLETPTRFLSTIQIGVTLAGFLASAFASDQFSEPLVKILLNYISIDEDVIKTISVVIITLLLSYITLVFGELVPKRIAMSKAEPIAFGVVGILRVISIVALPFVNFLSFTTNSVLRLFGFNPDEEPNQVTEEEIRMMVDVGEEKGTIRETEKEMINNIFEFDNKLVSEVMTHRREISGIPVEATLAEVKKILKNEQYTRFPIYDDSIDNIVGIVHLKDLLKYYDQAKTKTFSLQKIMRKPYFVPESKHIDELFFELQKNNTHFAVVIDEYGGTAGIITIEDLIEEIVGDISDEYDEDEKLIAQISENTYDLNASIELEELEERCGVDLPNEDYDTLSGFLIGLLGRIPLNHEQIDLEYEGILFKVLKIEDKRIIKVRMVKPHLLDNPQNKEE
jgi:putative hemolysin